MQSFAAAKGICKYFKWFYLIRKFQDIFIQARQQRRRQQPQQHQQRQHQALQRML